jgi:hypothetical protein
MESFTRASYALSRVCSMDRQLREWTRALERVWSAAAPDFDEAARLVSDIARIAEQAMLRQAASQALPILRNSALDGADHGTAEAARRRLGIVLDVLHDLTTPKFGRRDVAPKPLTVEARARKLLGLPLDRHLAGAEIHRAFRHAAKTMHPDAGGSEAAFLELAAARDALMVLPAKRDG